MKIKHNCAFHQIEIFVSSGSILILKQVKCCRLPLSEVWCHYIFPPIQFICFGFSSSEGNCCYVNRKEASGFAKYKMKMFLSIPELTPPNSDILPQYCRFQILANIAFWSLKPQKFELEYLFVKSLPQYKITLAINIKIHISIKIWGDM